MWSTALKPKQHADVLIIRLVHPSLKQCFNESPRQTLTFWVSKYCIFSDVKKWRTKTGFLLSLSPVILFCQIQCRQSSFPSLALFPGFCIANVEKRSGKSCDLQTSSFCGFSRAFPLSLQVFLAILTIFTCSHPSFKPGRDCGTLQKSSTVEAQPLCIL